MDIGDCGAIPGLFSDEWESDDLERTVERRTPSDAELLSELDNSRQTLSDQDGKGGSHE